MKNLATVATILVIKDYSDFVLYKKQFDEFLNEKTLVIYSNAFNQFSTDQIQRKTFSIENKIFKKVADVSDFTIYTEKPSHVSIGLYDIHYAKYLILNDSNIDDVSDFTIYTEKPSHVSIGLYDIHYAKYLILNDSNIDDVEYLAKNCNYPLPYDFAENNALSFEDEDGDITELNLWHDVKFSYSCGYYDSSEKTVLDFKLYCSDDVVTLHNGKKAHCDDVVYCDALDEHYLYNDCVRLHNDTYLPEHMTIYVNGEYYAEDDSDISTCEGCNDHFHYDDLIYSESQDASYCESFIMASVVLK